MIAVMAERRVMYLTEEDAKKQMICPVRSGINDGYCIGSRCGAWRFERIREYRYRTESGQYIEDLGNPPFIEKYGDKGYCGLAGKI